MTMREVFLAVEGLYMKEEAEYGLYSRLAMAIAASGFNPKAATFVKKLFPALNKSEGMSKEDVEKRRAEGLKFLEKINQRNGGRLKNTGNSGRKPGRKGAE